MTRRVIFGLLLLGGGPIVGFAADREGSHKRLPVKIYFMAGQSNMVGHLPVTFVQENHPQLMTPRDDVFCARAGRVSGKLQPGYGSREHSCGMELMMGKVLGDAVPNPILFVKSCTGGTTLHHDWRPPSAVKRAGGEIGPLYTRMMRRWHNVLANIDLHVPGAADRGYEIAGFVWFQGENDCCRKDADGKGYWDYYEENLEDLLHDVRGDLGVPELPALIVQINDGCWDGLPGRGGTVLRPVQQKVAEADPHATWIKTCDLNQGYHYDAASYITIGERGGKAMLQFARSTVPQTKQEVLAGRARFLARQPKPGTPNVKSLVQGLIGYWKFDEGTGSRTADRSAGINDGNIMGNPAWTDGLFGKAVKLTGQQRIEIPRFEEPTGSSGNIENLSVAYWVCTNRFGDARVGRGTGIPIEPRTDHNWFLSDTANQSGWDICTHDCDYCGLATAAFDNGPKTVMSDRPAHLVGDGIEWHHVVMTYQGRNKCFRIYVNADPFDSKRSTESLAGIEEANHIIPAGEGVPLTLGGLIDRAGQFQIFDELAIWQRAITPEEVETLYNNGFGAEIPVADKDERDRGWTFVSMPDFLNVDTEYPQSGWEDALSYILKSVRAEDPEFVLVAGDLVMGRWWTEADIDKYAAKYYPAWVQRMQAHDLEFYTAIGDHELGDNPWPLPRAKLVPKFKAKFREYLNMPTNGPEHMKGTAFWWMRNGVLFVSVDVFEEADGPQGKINPQVTGKQLAWLENVLEENKKDAHHIVVMGHTPILGPVRAWSSSRLMLSGGRESPLWQTMKRHGVDLYLCGEVHAITCIERDGIWQISHGGLIGYNTRTNYLRIRVMPERLDLELKEIDMVPSGDHLWQVGNNRPLENVTIPDDVRRRGFVPVGRLTLDKSGSGPKFRGAKGYFRKEYEPKTAERYGPAFRRGRDLVEPPRVVIDDVGSASTGP